MGYLTPQIAHREYDRYGRNIQALGQEHPERIPLYCKLLVEVAPTVRGKDAYEESNGNRDWTAENLFDMAIRLDRPGNDCLAHVVAALPRTPAVQQEPDIAFFSACLHHIQSCQRHNLEPPMR